MLPHQRSKHLKAEPVADVPVTDIPLIEEVCKSGQVGAIAQSDCRKEDRLQEEDADELVLRAIIFEQHQGEILLLPDGRLSSVMGPTLTRLTLTIFGGVPGSTAYGVAVASLIMVVGPSLFLLAQVLDKPPQQVT